MAPVRVTSDGALESGFGESGLIDSRVEMCQGLGGVRLGGFAYTYVQLIYIYI